MKLDKFSAVVFFTGLVFACSDDGGSEGAGGSAVAGAGGVGGAAGTGGAGGAGGSAGTSGAAGVGGMAGTGGGGDGTAECAAVCSNPAVWKCPSDTGDCNTACATARAQVAMRFPNCVNVFDAANACTGKLPAEAFECSAQGQTTLKAGYCTAERDAFTACVQGVPSLADQWFGLAVASR